MGDKRVSEGMMWSGRVGIDANMAGGWVVGWMEQQGIHPLICSMHCRNAGRQAGRRNGLAVFFLALPS